MIAESTIFQQLNSPCHRRLHGIGRRNFHCHRTANHARVPLTEQRSLWSVKIDWRHHSGSTVLRLVSWVAPLRRCHGSAFEPRATRIEAAKAMCSRTSTSLNKTEKTEYRKKPLCNKAQNKLNGLQEISLLKSGRGKPIVKNCGRGSRNLEPPPPVHTHTHTHTHEVGPLIQNPGGLCKFGTKSRTNEIQILLIFYSYEYEPVPDAMNFRQTCRAGQRHCRRWRRFRRNEGRRSSEGHSRGS